MALMTQSLTYIGQPSSPSQGQTVANMESGPLAKTLVGYCTFTGTTTSTKTATVNFIDGTQKLAQYAIVINLQSATAPATINGVANQSIISGVGAMGQIPVGASITTVGFTNSGNNGTFTVNAVTSSGVQITNSSAVAETNYAATLSYYKGPAVQAVMIARSGNTSDTDATPITWIYPSALSNTGFTANLSASLASGSTLSAVVVIYLAS